MADNFDVGTLLPVTTLRRILQLVGSMATYDPSVGDGTSSRQRSLYVQLFTGRMPTTAEFFYGTFIDRTGDSSRSGPMTLAHRYLGYFQIDCDGSVSSTSYLVGHDLQMSGPQWPEGVHLVPYNDERAPLPPKAHAQPSWLLDWTFSSQKNVVLEGNQNSTVRSLQASGDLIHDGKPTWFVVTQNPTPLGYSMNLHRVYQTSDEGGQYHSFIQKHTYNDDYWNRQPILAGTVGAVGSGADLELAVGADDVSPSEIRPTALRVTLEDIT